MLCLGVTLLLVTCLVHLMAWLHPQGERDGDPNKDPTKLDRDPNKDPSRRDKAQKTKGKFPGPSPDDGFWYLYGALLSQGQSQII